MRYADYVVGDDLSNSEFSQLQLSQVEGNYSVNTSYQAINVVGSSIDSGSDGVPLAEPRPWAVGGGLEAYGDGGVVFGAAVHPEEPCPSVGVVPPTVGETVEGASQGEAGGPQESVAGSGFKVDQAIRDKVAPGALEFRMQDLRCPASVRKQPVPFRQPPSHGRT